MTGTSTCSTIAGTARAAASVFTVTRTSSLPAAWSALDLRDGGVHVRRVGIGHGLDDDGMLAADLHPAHVHRDRLLALGSAHVVVRSSMLGIVARRHYTIVRPLPAPRSSAMRCADALPLCRSVPPLRRHRRAPRWPARGKEAACHDARASFARNVQRDADSGRRDRKIRRRPELACDILSGVPGGRVAGGSTRWPGVPRTAMSSDGPLGERGASSAAPSVHIDCARVAELADALDLGSRGANPVGVQLPPLAPELEPR